MMTHKMDGNYEKWYHPKKKYTAHKKKKKKNFSTIAFQFSLNQLC